MEFKEKFIGFVDILGFEELVKSAESGIGMSLSELIEILKKLGVSQDRDNFDKYGPTICPQSEYLQRNLNFRVTQISDCAIVSSETSPAGAINLIHYCWSALFKLLLQGIMCRGYITRGNVYHTNDQIIGTAYMKACKKEKEIAIFKREADERGTPFVEVDPIVCDYISNCNDPCVKKMFTRYIKGEGEDVALFPFKSLVHSFMIGGFGQTFDPKKEKKSNQNLRMSLIKFKERITAFIDKSNPSAVQKGEHYLQALNAQLAVCDSTDKMLAGKTTLRDYRGQTNSP